MADFCNGIRSLQLITYNTKEYIPGYSVPHRTRPVEGTNSHIFIPHDSVNDIVSVPLNCSNVFEAILVCAMYIASFEQSRMGDVCMLTGDKTSFARYFCILPSGEITYRKPSMDPTETKPDHSKP